MLVVFNDRLLSATQYQEQYHDLWKLILVWLWARTKMCSPLRKGSRKEKKKRKGSRHKRDTWHKALYKPRSSATFMAAHHQKPQDT